MVCLYSRQQGIKISGKRKPETINEQNQIDQQLIGHEQLPEDFAIANNVRRKRLQEGPNPQTNHAQAVPADGVNLRIVNHQIRLFNIRREPEAYFPANLGFLRGSINPPIFNDPLPYPPEILDRLIVSYFDNAYWPMTVVHPRTFMDNRYKKSRTLLYAICCIGAQFSGFIGELNQDDIPGSYFFERALDSIDIVDVNLDNLSALILLFEFSVKNGKTSVLQYITELCAQYSKKLRLHIDPDIWESMYPRVRWNLIEKETFRRAYYFLVSNGAHFGDFPSTVRPMADIVWWGLPDDAYYADPPAHRPLAITDDSYDLNLIATELFTILRRIRTLLNLAFASSLDDITPDIEAKSVIISLEHWFTRMKIVVPLDRRPPTNWAGVYLHIVGHNFILLSYRFILVRFLRRKFAQANNIHNPEINDPEKTELVQFRRQHEIEAFMKCHKAVESSIDILRNIILVYDPELKNVPNFSTSLVQVLIFLGITRSYADTPDGKLYAAIEFEFVRDVMLRFGKTGPVLSSIIVAAIEGVEQNGWENCADLLVKLFTWTLDNMENDFVEAEE
ncbi:hypothetical protein HK098_004473 [Nowakowskiella sp. JEL0407]|nr:hypothetical protein HK098_004473 [Nowakowskiella sp. JEL0407]